MAEIKSNTAEWIFEKTAKLFSNAGGMERGLNKSVNNMVTKELGKIAKNGEEEAMKMTKKIGDISSKFGKKINPNDPVETRLRRGILNYTAASRMASSGEKITQESYNKVLDRVNRETRLKGVGHSIADYYKHPLDVMKSSTTSVAEKALAKKQFVARSTVTGLGSAGLAMAATDLLDDDDEDDGIGVGGFLGTELVTGVGTAVGAACVANAISAVTKL